MYLSAKIQKLITLITFYALVIFAVEKLDPGQAGLKSSV